MIETCYVPKETLGTSSQSKILVNHHCQQYLHPVFDCRSPEYERTDLHQVSAIDAYFDIRIGYGEITVLIDNTCFTLDEFLDGRIRPPRNAIAIFIVLTTVIVESMRHLMPNHHTDA